MLTSYSVSCPHPGCDWTGSLIPSILQGGKSAEIRSMQRAWFHCPQCERDWEVSITNDRITIVAIPSSTTSAPATTSPPADS